MAEDNPDIQSINYLELLKQQAIQQSLAISNSVAPTDPSMAEVAHKIALIQPKNPAALRELAYNSGFTGLMADVYGQMAIEMEAPERLLAVFPAQDAQKRVDALELRLLEAQILCCDQLDVRNPKFNTFMSALRDQSVYLAARTNKDYWRPERDYQAQTLSTAVTEFSDKGQPEAKPRLIERLNPFARRRL